MSSRGIGTQLLDLLFPPRCQVCGRFFPDPLCQTCRGRIEFIGEQPCPCCGTILPETPPDCLPGGLCRDCRSGRWFSGARSVGLHAGALRDAILAYKFEARRRLAEAFAEMLGEVFSREVGRPKRPGLPLDRCEALVPVPLHPRRRAWRGFDQAELLCQKLARRLQMPVWTDGLVRTRYTQPQTKLRGDSRRRNVRDAFEARKNWRTSGRSLILVDDVFTTGATLEECAFVLKQAGATAVYGLTVSRAAPAWHETALTSFDALARGDSSNA